MATVNKSRVLPNRIVSAGNSESMRSFMDRRYAENPKKLRILAWGHYKRGLRYKTFRDVFSSADGAQGFKTTMAELSESLTKGREVAQPGAGGDVLEAITSYPFAVLEPDFMPPRNYSNSFIEEGSINLPFPMLS